MYHEKIIYTLGNAVDVHPHLHAQDTQEYFIRVENMSPNVTGYYNLTVGNPFNNPISISGNSNLCNTETYQVSGLPTGTTVTWSASPPNLASFSCNSCLQPEITSIGTGEVTLKASIKTEICNIEFQQEITKKIRVGAPYVGNSSFLASGPSCVNSGAVSFGVKYNGSSACGLISQGITEIEWNVMTNYPHAYQLTYNAGIYACYGVNNAGLRMTFSKAVTQPYIVTLLYRVKNACGWSQWSPGNYYFLNPCSGNRSFNIFPNPTNGILNISMEDQSLTKSKTGIREIIISDKLGNMIKRYNYDNTSKNSTSVDVSNLKADIYFIKVFDGFEWRMQSFIKN